ncbi:hypothetical protein Esi_0048_0105 [Ectocarpus siliculosus]|uniref:Uncharacterized protein n=1 Tax=Ectocarpus siliculosus TaxID=2880 RepID=D7G2Q5_ECTSI|nr:hypothetical protein Esi_0048_0105 [Ectocarpus siliculosus]|eukprot:CBJ26880.1 hypothetical protein Esi_0048_0105 [Ectocarpus siliculosus]
MGDIDIFDAATSKKIHEEHQRDMEDAAKAIGPRGMALIRGLEKQTTTATTRITQSLTAGSLHGGRLLRKLAPATSLFSRKKPPAPTPAAEPLAGSEPAAQAPTAPTLEQLLLAEIHMATNAQPSSAATLELPPAVAESGSPETAAPTETTPEEPPAADDVGDVGRKPPPVPASETVAAATAAAAAAAGEPEPARRLKAEGKGSVEPARSASREPAEPAPSPPAAAPTKDAGSEAVLPELKVVSFDVREPTLGASVVGHVVVLAGSCYVWAATEGSVAQGSLAAAVGTRFDGGMPTATPLLAGEGAGEAGGGGVGVSMAQRLCKRTGRVVFVSCDLSEDSQILVAAVEAKVVALLKAED